MFHFPVNDKNNTSKRAPYRMVSQRHNPYVGSFHGLRIVTSTDLFFESNLEHKSNGPTELGLKRILYQKDELKPSVISQLNVTRTSTSLPIKRSFLKSLKQIPLKVYSSSAGSRSSLSFHGDDPVCAICIEPYKDGDELLTLSCDHCFHKDCVNKWFFQGCLNNADGNAVNCPECRQEHQGTDCPSLPIQRETLQQRQSVNGDTQTVVSGLEFSSASFFDVGAKLVNEGGYDFMSDWGSETSNPVETTVNETQESLARLDLLSNIPHKTEMSTIIERSQMTSADTCSTSDSTSSSSSSSEGTMNVSTAPTVAMIEESVVMAPTIVIPLEESTFSDCGYPLLSEK